MSHDFREQAALFVVGALDEGEREAFVEHLRTCAECAAEVAVQGELTSAMAQAVPPQTPSPQLRERILSAAARQSGVVAHARVGGPAQAPVPQRPDVRTPSRSIGPWLAMAASMAVAVALGAYALSLRSRVGVLEAQLEEAQLRVAESERKMAGVVQASAVADSRLAVLTAPDMTRVVLAGQPPVAPQASGRAFWSPTRGLVLTASGVPALPPARTYQLWLVTADRADQRGADHAGCRWHRGRPLHATCSSVAAGRGSDDARAPGRRAVAHRRQVPDRARQLAAGMSAVRGVRL